MRQCDWKHSNIHGDMFSFAIARCTFINLIFFLAMANLPYKIHCQYMGRPLFPTHIQYFGGKFHICVSWDIHDFYGTRWWTISCTNKIQ